MAPVDLPSPELNLFHNGAISQKFNGFPTLVPRSLVPVGAGFVNRRSGNPRSFMTCRRCSRECLGRRLASSGNGGEGWIRTSVRLRGQIYSLLPLTTRPPLQVVATRGRSGGLASMASRRAMWRRGFRLSTRLASRSSRGAKTGAGEGNRTLVVSLEGFCSTIELHPPGRLGGPMPLAARARQSPPGLTPAEALA